MRIVAIRFLAIVVILAIGVLFIVRYESSRPNTEDVRAMISRQLVLGASSQDIEIFFQRNAIEYSYDKYNDRYHGIIRDVSPYPLIDKAIEIDLMLGEGGELEEIAVYSTFSFI